MDFQGAKRLIASDLKKQGFAVCRTNRICVQDHGYYLLFAELIPAWGEAFFTDFGVMFLWTGGGSLIYNYSPTLEDRIYPPQSATGAIFYKSATFDVEVDYVINELHARIEKCKKFDDFEFFRYSMEHRDDSIVHLYGPGYEKRNIEYAIVRMFSGDTEGAYEILHNDPKPEPIRAELLKCSNDPQLFYEKLIEIINNCRAQLSAALKIKLSPIDKLWNDILL